MSDPPASYIVEQAHLQCSVYCVCPMFDVTHTSCLLTVSMELSTPRVHMHVLVSVCGTPDTQLATEELGIRMA